MIAETNNCPATLQPKKSCTISVTFQPTAKKSRSASVVISRWCSLHCTTTGKSHTRPIRAFVKLVRMSLTDIVSSIDSEIAALQQARALLTGTGSRTVKAGRPSKRKYKLSAEARERIAAAQRKRWAAQTKAAKKAD